MKRVFLIVLAVIGGLTLTAFAGIAVMLWLMGPGGTDITVDQRLPSPDGLQAATLYTGMGGGAAGWCFRRISIDPRADPFSAQVEERAQKRAVFSGRCVLNPTMQWRSSSELQISLAAVQHEWASHELRDRDASGQVKVSFVLESSAGPR